MKRTPRVCVTRNTPYYTQRIGEQSARRCSLLFPHEGSKRVRGARERICVLKCIYKVCKATICLDVCCFKTCEKHEITRYCTHSAVEKNVCDFFGVSGSIPFFFFFFRIFVWKKIFISSMIYLRKYSIFLFLFFFFRSFLLLINSLRKN